MSVCVYSVFVVMCRQRPCDGLITRPRNIYRIKKLRKRPRSKGLQSHRGEEEEDVYMYVCVCICISKHTSTYAYGCTHLDM
jgi:hypothetical protein